MAVLLVAACSGGNESAPVGPAAPELSAKTSCSSNPLPTYPGEQTAIVPPLIAEQLCLSTNLSPANAQSALVKWLAIIRLAPNPPADRVFGLFDFVSKNWLAGPTSLAEFRSDLLLVVFGVSAPPDPLLTVLTVGTGGGSFCSNDGLTCWNFPSGWSLTSRLVISYPIDCSVVSGVLAILGACEHHETVPDGSFELPVTLIQCFEGDENDVTPVLVKRFEAPGDPLGTNVEDVEVFLSSAAATLPPGCTTPSAARTASTGAGPSPGALREAGGKLGPPSGLQLQGRGVGSQVTAFSDWGFTDLDAIPVTIEGVISGGASPLPGAQVELFCETDSAARQSTVSAGDGSYAFDGAAGSGGFESGDTCEVRASASGFASGSSGTFDVVLGTNAVDLTLSALQPSATTVSGTVRHSPVSCGPVECSSSLVGGADVTLFCSTTSGPAQSFSDATTTGNDGGSSSFGRYAFTRALPGFGPGWQCTVQAAFGNESGTEGPFAVQSGGNTVNLRIF